MTTYAILGATGQTGSELVKALLPTSAHLNIYARSRDRLLTKNPSLSTATNVTLFIGDLSDTTLLTSCLSNADIILSTVAQNRNEPGCSIAQRIAYSIIQALETRRSTSKVPTLVFIASGSVDPANPHKDEVLFRFLHWTLHHIYDDLEIAIKILNDNPWIPLVVACPGGLVHDPLPHSIELTSDIKQASPLTSYVDLARGMIMMGEEGEKWRGKYVSLYLNDGKAIGGNPLALLRYLLPNFLASACSPLWWLGKDWWPA